MDKIIKLLRQFTLKRTLLLVVLTTVATAIIKPYFLYGVSFSYLWLRLFIVGVVMLVAYIFGGFMYDRVLPQRFWQRFTLVQAQFVALVAGAVVGTIVSGLVIGRSLNEMVTNQAIFWGMVIFTGAGIALGVFTRKGDFKKMGFAFNNLQAYNFLHKNGFSRFKSESKKEGYIYIHKTGNKVEEKRSNDIKNYIHGFLEQRRMDVQPYLGYAVFERLREPAFFALAQADHGTVSWPAGIDLDPDSVYLDSVPVDQTASA